MVVPPKDKERYPRLLTKQNAQGPGRHVGLSHFKTMKEIQVPLQRDLWKKDLMYFVEVNIG